MIEINQEKCIKCGRCVQTCIRNIFRLDSETVSIVDEEKCVECMHCIVSCPCDAIRINHKGSTGERADFVPNQSFTDEFEKLYRCRRSYRYFTDEIVPCEVVRTAISLSAYAASTKNEHPVGYYVVEGSSRINEMMNIILAHLDSTGESPEIRFNLEHNGLNSVFGTAKTIIISYADSGLNPHTDAAISLTGIELYLQSRGIGTCWAGYLTRFLNEMTDLREYLDIPEERKFYGALMVGYPTEEYLTIPSRRMPDINYIK